LRTDTSYSPGPCGDDVRRAAVDALGDVGEKSDDGTEFEEGHSDEFILEAGQGSRSLMLLVGCSGALEHAGAWAASALPRALLFELGTHDSTRLSHSATPGFREVAHNAGI
jgi:hypothetical protein